VTTHRYDRSAIVKDYWLGGSGFAITAGPLLFVPMASWVSVVFAGLALLFGTYVLRAWTRRGAAIELDDVGIRLQGLRPRAIRWDALERMDLRYFATRRDKEAGWMELKLRGAGGGMAVESSLDGFDAVVARTAEAAIRNRLDLSHTTRENLKALGLPVPVDPAGADAVENSPEEAGRARGVDG
jgi:hypothetical protein